MLWLYKEGDIIGRLGRWGGAVLRGRGGGGVQG